MGTCMTLFLTMSSWFCHCSLLCVLLRSNGFELSASKPALYRSELVHGFCHGDEFMIAAAEDHIDSFGKLLQEKFDARRIGMIGAAEHLDKELEVLHRSVTVVNSTFSNYWKILDSFKATLSRL